MFKLALRNIFRQQRRTALVVATIMSGIIGLILVGGFIEDILLQLREVTIQSRLGHLQVFRTGYATQGRVNPYLYMIEASDELTDQLSSEAHVTDVLRRLAFSGLLNNGRADMPVVGEGVEPEKESRLGQYFSIINGRSLHAHDTYSILLGEGLAKSLDLKIGDHATLLLNTTTGALNTLEFEVIGIFRTFSREFDARAVRIPLTIGQELLDTHNVHNLVFLLDDTDATNRVADLVSQQLSQSEYEVKTWSELDDFYNKTAGMYRGMFGVLEIIVLIVVTIGAANSVTMNVYERVGEFGTLKALGNRHSDIFKLMLIENTLLGLIGGVLGGCFGMILAWSISQVGIPMPPPPNSEMGYTALIRVVPSVVIVASLIGTLATILAAILPVHHAARISITDSLRRNI